MFKNVVSGELDEMLTSTVKLCCLMLLNKPACFMTGNPSSVCNS